MLTGRQYLRLIAFWIATGILMSIGAGGSAWAAEPAPAPAGNEPQAVFPEKRYAFGSVMEGTDIKHDFVVENHGRAPLSILKVQPD